MAILYPVVNSYKQYTHPYIVHTCSIPISDIAKQQCPNQHSQHKGRLCKFGEPFLVTHQVPFCDNALLHLTMIKHIATARLHRFIASKLIREVFSVTTKHFATGSKFPLLSVQRPHHHRPVSRCIKWPDLLQWACWVVPIQDISDVLRSIAKKLWRLHQENRGQVVNAAWCGLENSSEVEAGLKPSEKVKKMNSWELNRNYRFIISKDKYLKFGRKTLLYNCTNMIRNSF